MDNIGEILKHFKFVVNIEFQESVHKRFSSLYYDLGNNFIY